MQIANEQAAALGLGERLLDGAQRQPGALAEARELGSLRAGARR